MAAVFKCMILVSLFIAPDRLHGGEHFEIGLAQEVDLVFQVLVDCVFDGRSANPYGTFAHQRGGDADDPST